MARSSLGLLILTLVACSGSTDTVTDATTPSGGETVDAAGDAPQPDLVDLATAPEADGEAPLDTHATASATQDGDEEGEVAPPTVPDAEPDPGADANSDLDSATSPDESDVVEQDPCPELSNGALCDDGDVCTSGDYCTDGVCQPGELWVCGEPCAQNFDTIQSMPPGSKMIDMENCADEACCDPNQAWPTEWIPWDCKASIPQAIFAEHGIKLTGGIITEWVYCITGNEDAPTSGRAIHTGGAFKPSPTTYGLEFQFDTPISTFGLVAVPSASDPIVILRGYDAAGLEVGYDTFNFGGLPFGDLDRLDRPCGEMTNMLARFFGFRSCSGQMSRVVAEFTDPNVVVDTVMFFE